MRQKPECDIRDRRDEFILYFILSMFYSLLELSWSLSLHGIDASALHQKAEAAT